MLNLLFNKYSDHTFLFLRGLSLLLNFLIFFVVSLVIPVDKFGTFSVFYNISFFLSIILLFGIDQSVFKFYSIKIKDNHISFLIISILLVLLIFLLILISLFLEQWLLNMLIKIY